ncbi:MAG: hypothetical protein ACK5II_07485 [Paracoccus sp. (in: a-proteobacteria)]
MAEDTLADSAAQAKAAAAENALAARILVIVLAVLIIAAVTIALFGPVTLGIIGLVGTTLCFVIMLAFMAGN